MQLNRDQLCRLYLKQLYHNFQPAPITSPPTQDLAATQGEILPESLDRLLGVLPLRAQDIFYDLGSGTGQVTLQVFLKTPVGAAYGIEWLPALHQQSLRLAQQLEQDLPEFYAEGRELHFIQGNFLEIPLAAATVILMNSVCFSQDTLLEISRVINNSPKLHSLLSLRPLPALEKWRCVTTISTECSWDTALCYLYQRSS